MKIKKIVSGIACMVTLAACNLDYHEYANYGKDYIDESYENVIGMITNVYSILDYDFGQTYKGGMLASACDEAEYAYTNNDICDFVNGSWSQLIQCLTSGLVAIKQFRYVISIWLNFKD